MPERRTGIFGVNVKGETVPYHGASEEELLFSKGLSVCSLHIKTGARPLPCLCRLQEGLQQGLASTMKKYNISTNRIQVVKDLYDKDPIVVLFNDSIGDWFQTTVGV